MTDPGHGRAVWPGHSSCTQWSVCPSGDCTDGPPPAVLREVPAGSLLLNCWRLPGHLLKGARSAADDERCLPQSRPGAVGHVPRMSPTGPRVLPSVPHHSRSPFSLTTCSDIRCPLCHSLGHWAGSGCNITGLTQRCQPQTTLPTRAGVLSGKSSAFGPLHSPGLRRKPQSSLQTTRPQPHALLTPPG